MAWFHRLGLAFGLVALAYPILAQDLPSAALASYSKYRVALISSGWKPVRQQGVLGRDGKPMYGYPEVVCGNRTCSADWLDKSGRKVSIGLWRNATNQLVLAPELQFN